MNALDFKKKWCNPEKEFQSELNVFPKDQVLSLDLSISEKEFLYLSGLPSSCAPFLSFGDYKNTQLKKLKDEWNLDDSFDELYVIGSTGSGDPICIDSQTGFITFFNHDNDFEEIFINSSLEQLAKFLLIARDGISEVTSQYPLDTVWDASIQLDAKQKYKQMFMLADIKVFEEKGFWSGMFE